MLKCATFLLLLTSSTQVPLAIRTYVLYNVGVLKVIVLVVLVAARIARSGDHENNNFTCRHIHPRRGPG